MESVIVIVVILLFCLVLPITLLIVVVNWLARRKARSIVAQTSVATTPAALDELERLLDRWLLEGRLAAPSAAEIRSLIEQERQARLGPVAAIRPSAAAPSTDLSPQAESLPPAVPAAPPQAALGERLWDALLSLRTRQTLLFLGAFLLVISSLILIVFNWASFPPILQFAMLAGVCGAFWGGGAWLGRQTTLAQASAGLQAVGGVLVPLVAFSLSRPGLLDLAPRPTWLLVSALSLPIYALAAWRLRRPIYTIAACLSAASAVLASLSAVENQWLPLALVLTLAAYLPLARWLRRRAPELAAGPGWVAQIGVPAALLIAYLGQSSGETSVGALASTLWAGAAFYLLAAWLDHRPAWSWPAAVLPPAALLASLAALQAESPWWGVVPALAALAYLGLALAIEPRARRLVLPLYLGAGALALLALAPSIQTAQTARWTLQLLLAGSAAITLAYHRGRLAWLAEAPRLTMAALGLLGAGVLLTAWTLALLDLTALDTSWRGLALLPLAALYAGLAWGWPGRLRPPYDWALQLLAVALAIGAGGATLLEQSTRAPGMAALTVFWVLQTLLRRRGVWAAAALGSALLAGAIILERLDPELTPDRWIALGLAFTATYLIGATLLRRTAWRLWTWPGIGWGSLAGLATLLLIGVGLADAEMALWQHVAALLALAVLVELVAVLWRIAWPGYIAAPLLALAALLAASRGFFTGWQPATGDYGYVLCGLTFGLALIGQAARRAGPRYAYPYEITGYTLLIFAPLATMGSPQHATLTWAAMALLYALAAWRYRLRWAIAPALLAADFALLSGSSWLVVGGRPAGAGMLLLAAAWAQALIGLWSSRRRLRPTAPDRLGQVEPAYVVALLSGLGGLALARSADDVLAIVAIGLAALLAIIGTLHRREAGAWGALALLAIGLASLHRFLAVDPLWSAAWGAGEALIICLIGWAIETVKRSIVQMLDMWQRPLWLGPLLAGLGLAAGLLVVAPLSASLPPLTFGLATLGLLLATLAVRRRAVEHAYAAGAAFVLAGLCQIYDWGFRQPQWYAFPAGLYLLALAEGLRRFQGRRRLSQLIESAAAALLLGVTFGQSLRAEGLESQLYAIWLCVESLALLGYGLLRRLRAPFFGGVGFFVAGVLWLSVDPLLAANKWVLLGILGLLLIGAYLLLERRQEQLLRAGRAWAAQVSRWG